MPNKPVRAAAEGLPADHPQVSALFDSLRRHLSVSNAGRGHLPRKPEETIMNVAVNRRTVLSAAAIVPGVAIAEDAAATPSPLSDLIADYRHKKAESKALFSEWCTLNDQLPKRYVDLVTGERFWSGYEDLVREHYRVASWMPDDIKVMRECAEVLDRLKAQQAAYDEAYKASSRLRAIDEADDRLFDEMDDIRKMIYAYTPRNMREVAERNAFLLRDLMVGEEMDFPAEDLEMIFGG